VKVTHQRGHHHPQPALVLLRIVTILVALDKTSFIHPHDALLHVRLRRRHRLYNCSTRFLPQLVDALGTVSPQINPGGLAEPYVVNDDTSCLLHAPPHQPHSHARISQFQASHIHSRGTLIGEMFFYLRHHGWNLHYLWRYGGSSLSSLNFTTVPAMVRDAVALFNRKSTSMSHACPPRFLPAFVRATRLESFRRVL